MSKVGFLFKFCAYMIALAGILSLGGRWYMWEYWVVLIAMGLNGIISKEDR